MRHDETSKERKVKKRKPSTDSESATSSDENRKRRERKRERKEKKHRKSEKRKKDKRKKRRGGDDSASDDQIKVKDKRSKHKDKRRKSEEHHYQKKGSRGDVAVLKELSQDDYFLKNKEFSTWLKEEHGMFFSNLSSDKARELFLEFVKSWNCGQLRSEYYEGINSAPRTDHNWGIKIEKKTVSEDPAEEREIAKRIEKSERRKFHKMQEEILNELLPKATGHEKILEKRVIRREQAKTREESPELALEKDLMGGGDDFRVRLEKERMRKEKKEIVKSALLEEKLQASRQKEAAAMSQLQAIINDAGGKITIPKRN